MSSFRRFELIDHSPFLPAFFEKETSLFSTKSLTLDHPYFPSFPLEHELDFTLDLLNPAPKPLPALLDFPSPSLFDTFHTITDLTQVEKTPFCISTRRVQHRVDQVGLRTEFYLQRLCDRVSALELSFDRLAKEKKSKVGERKYTWTAEIKAPEEDGVDRKYKWTSEIKDGKKKGHLEKNYKYTAEIKGKGEDSPISRKYTFTASTGDAGESSGKEKKDVEKKDKKKRDKSEKSTGGCSTRIVEIQEEPSHHGALVLRQAFARRVDRSRGKRKELSPNDAAIKIQLSFKAYLIKRSKALRALRELAIAKSKLKEIRALFNNFSYRRRLARDTEERQRFSEKIIVLLLTVDAIEGADVLVRAAKKSMVDELEAMLDVVDPQPAGRSLSLKRRTFDMPDAVIQKELAAGVAQVVQMLDEEANGSDTI
ncbi:BAG family molecular chaperone regulator 7-like [Coffea arabica]|uniref:BAG family molecular chaperone regulator 7-like isoform X1 n=1 Tax=Coffea arabica TaxID=13443 RepID=A0A6P6VN81_COFAR|nr:BAG family molecular chaperone regulator 7-like isoform X1 [Coffea arabica]XP_027103949.1 BAG family molecular chaperone regulator 7-like isoform X2 [Coffea arabica]XP_027103950.1 BAG family molecular chaperone regulator 7-like isoform X1 [Coffea arabica]XP_027103951.1 BAG family molecular chaperone regulator 7-like isoform X2 [Coffea arabica]